MFVLAVCGENELRAPEKKAKPTPTEPNEMRQRHKRPDNGKFSSKHKTRVKCFNLLLLFCARFRIERNVIQGKRFIFCHQGDNLGVWACARALAIIRASQWTVNGDRKPFINQMYSVCAFWSLSNISVNLLVAIIIIIIVWLCSHWLGGGCRVITFYLLTGCAQCLQSLSLMNL